MADRELPKYHPTAVAFLDESGAIARDRFFAVGCLKLAEPATLLRGVQLLRDKTHWYKEIHFTELTAGALPVYQRVVDLLATSGAEFSCFVSDRMHADPVSRFGGQFEAYEALSAQLLVGSIRRRELVTVLADNYSAPARIAFEHALKARVNTRLGRLAITNVVRLDSGAADPLQLADLLVSAVAFEFRQSAGLAGGNTPKAILAAHVRQAYQVASFLGGCRAPGMNVKIYGQPAISRLPSGPDRG